MNKKMEKIKPFNKKNSIKTVAFIVAFKKPLDENTIKRTIEEVRLNGINGNNFDGMIEETQEVTIRFTTNSEPSLRQPESGGIVCRDDNEESEVATFEINKNLMVLICKKYTTWNETSKKIIEYFNKCFDIFRNSGENASVAEVALEYFDEFLILDEKDWKKELFNNSSFLPSNIDKTSHYWHVNHGYFLPYKDYNDGILANISIAYMGEMGQKKVIIQTQHKITNIYDDKIEALFDIIHTCSSNVFRDIVNQQVLKDFN